MNDTLLMVAAHANDEALGCGGTIARHVVAGGCTEHVVFMADGVNSRPRAERAEPQARLSAALGAQAILSVSHIHSFGLSDNRKVSFPLLDVAQQLEPVI